MKRKRRIRFELVIDEKKDKEIDGEKRHTGFVEANGQPFHFLNLPMKEVRQYFIRTAELCLEDMGVK